jgi:hypothetical protein
MLMGQDGNSYKALMKDISLGGALFEVSGDTHLHVGDSCTLMLGSSSSGFPVKRTFEIVRFDSENMGISFLT